MLGPVRIVAQLEGSQVLYFGRVRGDNRTLLEKRASANGGVLGASQELFLDSRGVIENGASFVSFMRGCADPDEFELAAEDIFAVAPARHPVVHDESRDHPLGSFIAEIAIFANCADPLAVPLNSLSHRRSIRTSVACQALRPDIVSVVSCCSR